MSEPPAPRCLCIVSGHPVRSGELLDALRTMVKTHDVEVIVDRRRGESDSATDRRPADRRHQPSVDARLKLDGYAMVPDPPPSLADPPLDGILAGRSFDELLAGAPLDEADPDEPELESVLAFNRQRKDRRRRRLTLTLLVGSTLALLFVTLVLTMKAFTSPTRPSALPAAESTSTMAMPPPLAPTDASPQSASPQSDESLRSPVPTPPAVKEPTPPAVKEPTPPAVKEPTPPPVKRTRPHAKPAASPPMRRPSEPVHSAPAPKVVQSPEIVPPPPPSEGSGGAGPAAQAATTAEVAAPRAQVVPPTPPAASVPAPPAQVVPPTPPAASVPAPPAQIVPSTPPVASVPSPAPGRSPEAAPTGQAPTATIRDASPAPSDGSPSDRRVGGVGDQFKNLGAVMERDVIDATADAKRQGEDFKAIQNRFRRAWDGLKQGFTGPPEKSRE